MSGTLKFALLTGALTLATAILTFVIARQIPSRGFDIALLLLGALCSIPFVLGTHLANKHQWLPLNISRKRAIFSALPLILSLVAFFLGMVGWGDIQEHWVRSFLHLAHRQLPERYVGSLVLSWEVGFGAVVIAFLVWISISALTKIWKLMSLTVICAGNLFVISAVWLAAILLWKRTYLEIAFACFATFCVGALLALAIRMNMTPTVRTISFRVASAGILLIALSAVVTVVAHTTPEKQLPYLSQIPLWSSDLAQYGCSPDFGPSADLQSGQITFFDNETLGIAMTTKSVFLPSRKWEYQDCVISIDAMNGKKIAQTTLKGYLPHFSHHTDGTFEVSSDSMTVIYSRDLRQIPSELLNKSSDKSHLASKNFIRDTAAPASAFRSDSRGNLWFTRNGKDELLFKYPCLAVSLYALSETRTLAMSCGDFSVFDASGQEVHREGFVREKLNYIGRSSDHCYFLMTTYLWGYGDPSYLEEETILICDIETGKIVIAIKSDPLPSQQSWMALSPDSSLLAIGAQNKLRLYRLSFMNSNVSNPLHSNSTNK